MDIGFNPDDHLTENFWLWRILESVEFESVCEGIMVAAVDDFDPYDAGLEGHSLVHALIDQEFDEDDLLEFLDELVDQIAEILANDEYEHSVLEYIDLFADFDGRFSPQPRDLEALGQQWREVGINMYQTAKVDLYPDNPDGHTQTAVKPRVPHLVCVEDEEFPGEPVFTFIM